MSRRLKRFPVEEVLVQVLGHDEEGTEIEPEIEEDVSELEDITDFEPDSEETDQSTDGEGEAPEEQAPEETFQSKSPWKVTRVALLGDRRTVTQTQRLKAESYRREAGDSGTGTPEDACLPLLEEDRTLLPQLTDSVPHLDVSLLVSALRQENAVDLCVIQVPPELNYTNHMIIASGWSSRHISAMAGLLLKLPYTRLEGSNCDDWKCVDFGCVVVHLMLPETREKYELEKLWTLRSFDEQLMRIPKEILPEDFVMNLDLNETEN
ncbi:hypothetical protein DNTS_008970 [Danionella cerebrum]|uniref:Mitochondrial assembly of ribosomal large subunit protein 1 n=1 Tax=Danionella cerebrum TaxID=2873325 RepID=A0A553Q4D3_9TELE|nr:hypothetical protein DNTS_008970 [Danionella translucida]